MRIPEAERDEARAAIDNALAQHDPRFLAVLVHVLEDAVQIVDKSVRDTLVAEAIAIYRELYDEDESHGSGS